MAYFYLSSFGFIEFSKSEASDLLKAQQNSQSFRDVNNRLVGTRGWRKGGGR